MRTYQEATPPYRLRVFSEPSQPGGSLVQAIVVAFAVLPRPL